MKQCVKCKISKESSDFYTDSRASDGFRSRCKSCLRLEFGERYKNPKRKEYQRNYQRKESVKEYQKEYRAIPEHLEDHRRRQKSPKYKSKKLMRDKTRRKTDPNFKISGNLRSRINNIIKRDQRAGSAIRDLGCSVEFLRQYLESRFEPGMSWDNYGPQTWHIDHIIPLANFVLTNRTEFLIANHYLNLQPMWAGPNWKKGKTPPSIKFCEDLIKTICDKLRAPIQDGQLTILPFVVILQK